ncbi:MAG: type I restriction endonuclease subunit R [Paludibacteraceae bacterium]|nr:type I restriction endonuclease subunit R [Paludibacteraceae bacterium]
MKLIAENTQSTVVSKFEYTPSKRTAYQSEAQLEDALIAQLQTQGYEYVDIHTSAELEANLRVQLERLNGIKFTDNEWKGFFRVKLANQGASYKDKTVLLQDDKTSQLILIRDDRTFQNIKLIDKKHIHENHLQVIHQYKAEDGKRKCRYDVTILVNGLPLVHIELKRRGVAIKEAFNQINRYHRDAFGIDNGLFDYVQIFVISNGTETKYYSNTTSRGAFTELNRKKPNDQRIDDEGTKTCDSFEFTSFWADSENTPIRELTDFTATFFARHTLLNILTRYCVFTADQKMLVMRPYQIAATEAILQKILISSNKRTYGTINAGGFIWHTTGSGKTLTSFKTAQLCTQLDYVDKVLFVVDRKDLDYQTIKEYEKFKKGCVSHNKSTSVLHGQLSNEKDRIIITTIQKLNQFCKSEQKHAIYDRHVVIIFDECHRSQFGDMHKIIVKRFKKYHIFGFTGTPIFAENAQSELLTTAQVFGGEPDEKGRPVLPLHTYTVINAIADENVLPFKVEYIKTVGTKPGIKEEEVKDIDRERALLAPERIHNIVEYILQHFDQKTYRNRSYKLEDKRVTGFNSIFATASIDAAKLYYTEFQRQQDALPEEQRLKIALIYSYGPNEEVNGILDEENSDSAAQLDQSSRDFLEAAIADYNQMFSCNFDTSSDQFGNYYKDVSNRMKKRELDMLIVVNMFLTGFDATTLNTLWVDKNLRQHGLMQAYSRTNRILNTIKQFGNIVCFRNLEQETNDAITLFGDKNACNIVLLKSYDQYINGYTDESGKKHIGFAKIAEALKQLFPDPANMPLVGEEKEKEFIRLFGSYLRMVNLLNTFDRFEEDKANYISDFAEQDYKSVYLDLNEKYRHHTEGDVVDINDDLTFEIELIKQVEINIDYILELIAKKYGKDKVYDGPTLEELLSKAIGSSPALRNKRDLIDAFVKRYSPDKEIGKQWMAFVQEQAMQQLDEIIASENLKREQTLAFVRKAFQTGEVELQGTAITQCLPPLPLFSPNNEREQKKARVLAKLCDYFDRFYDIYEFE